MLTAKLENGTIISLVNEQDRAHLEALKEQESFYCPCCQAKLTLKLGRQRIWHFAHQSNNPCTIQTEQETPYHLHGKQQLYLWLKQQRIEASLETYLPQIKQRPDLMAKSNKQIYAIEFQCATIPIDTFIKRTLGYQHIGIEPVWIFGGNRSKRATKDIFLIQQLEWAAIRIKFPFIMYYCPNQKQFLFLQPLFAINATKTVAYSSFSPLADTAFSSCIHRLPKALTKDSALSVKHKWRSAIIRYPSKLQRYIHELLVNQSRSIHLFPVEAGWPTRYHFLIENPAYLWQTWILLGFLHFRRIGEVFSIQLLIRAFTSLVKTNIFRIRAVSFQVNLSLPLWGYLRFLAKIGIIKIEDNNDIRKLKEISLPTTQQQAYEQESALVQRLSSLHGKRKEMEQ